MKQKKYSQGFTNAGKSAIQSKELIYVQSGSGYEKSIYRQFGAINQRFESNEICLQEVGYMHCVPNHDWGPDRKDCCTLHYVFSGKGILMVNDRYYEIGPGQAFYISSSDIAYYRADAKDPWFYSWVRISGTKSAMIFDATKFPEESVLDDTKDGFIKNGINNIFEKASVDRDNAFIITGILYQFLGELSDRFTKAETETRAHSMDILNLACEYIHGHYNEKNVITKMADELHLTRTYLYKLFQQHMQISPLEYLEQYRLDRSCYILVGKNTPVTKVAGMVGYADYSSFFRAFRRRMGMTPKQYQDTFTVRSVQQDI